MSLFAAYAWFLATLPAFAPLTPNGVETAVALALTIAYAAAGGLAARRLATQLVAARPSRAPAASARSPATSPGR